MPTVRLGILDNVFISLQLSQFGKYAFTGPFILDSINTEPFTKDRSTSRAKIRIITGIDKENLYTVITQCVFISTPFSQMDRVAMKY